MFPGTVKALHFAVFSMNVSLLEFNFADFELIHCYCHCYCQNVCVVFNFVETFPSRNLQNKSHTKFKAFTVSDDHETDYFLGSYLRKPTNMI